MKVCKSCGEINTNDTEYCCYCGKNKFIYQEEIRCPECGQANDKSFDHCINCGATLREHEHKHQHGEVYEPVPVNLREEMAEIYGGGVTINTEAARCPHCNATVPVTAIFCSKCGTSVASLHEHRVVQRKVCPHCGNFNPLEAARCSYCFSNLGDAPTETLQITHGNQHLGELIVRQTYLEGHNGKMLICPNCETINDGDEPFCVNCGLKLVIEPVKKYCPNCGTENLPDSEFCCKCRWSFEGADPDKIVNWTCPRCEHVNSDEDAYCSKCGQKRKD